MMQRSVLLCAQSESTSGSSEGGSGGRRSRASVTAEDFSLEAAMGLYGLEHMEVMWERRLDTMALLGFGPGRIVLVFRGTNSLKNVVADLQACLFPVLNGHCCMRLTCHCLFVGPHYLGCRSTALASPVSCCGF